MVATVVHLLETATQGKQPKNNQKTTKNQPKNNQKTTNTIIDIRCMMKDVR